MTVHVIDGARCRQRATVGVLLSARYRHDSVVLPCYACELVGAHCVTVRSIAWVDRANLASCLAIERTLWVARLRRVFS